MQCNVTYTRRGHKYDTHAAESGPFSVPHECLRWATNLSCRNGSNKAERYMQKAPAETKAMKCNQRQRGRSHTIILPHAPLNPCCFSHTGDLLASKYSTASLPRIQDDRPYTSKRVINNHAEKIKHKAAAHSSMYHEPLRTVSRNNVNKTRFKQF